MAVTLLFFMDLAVILLYYHVLINNQWQLYFLNPCLCKYETKYSRMDQVKFFKGSLPQILLGPFLTTLSHISSYRWFPVESILVSFYTHRKQKHLRFSDVFRGYRKRPVAWNGLKRVEAYRNPYLSVHVKMSCQDAKINSNLPEYIFCGSCFWEVNSLE